MADLIDREELLNILEKNNEIYWGTAGGGYPVSKDIFEEIKFMNKANTERHAHWIKGKIPYEEYTCSNCGGACWYYDYSGTVCKSKYCPNCGCKMDEVKE